MHFAAKAAGRFSPSLMKPQIHQILKLFEKLSCSGNAWPEALSQDPSRNYPEQVLWQFLRLTVPMPMLQRNIGPLLRTMS